MRQVHCVGAGYQVATAVQVLKISISVGKGRRRGQADHETARSLQQA